MHRKLIRLRPEGTARGRILLSHRILGFLLEPAHPRLARHNQLPEAIALAEALVERGYAVDVVSHRRDRPVSRRDYDLFIGTRGNFEMLAARLPRTCLRIAMLDTTHWLFNNHASLARSLEVQRARGVTPERDIAIERNRAIEFADFALMLGNEATYETYAFAGRPVFELPNPAIAEWDWPEDKDHGAVRRHFLWLGSRGLAHKGLGRVLEAFAAMPDLRLSVRGPLAEEPHFCRAYRRELWECPNIDARDWIDVTGPEFRELARSTLALVYPSCAEAQSGSVINCMGAGLIPVVSRQAGVDVTPDFGALLPDDGPAAIQAAARALSGRPAPELAAMARRAWRIARLRHSREAYKAAVGAAVERILAGEVQPGGGFIRLPSAGGETGAGAEAGREALSA